MINASLYLSFAYWAAVYGRPAAAQGQAHAERWHGTSPVPALCLYRMERKGKEGNGTEWHDIPPEADASGVASHAVAHSTFAPDALMIGANFFSSAKRKAAVSAGDIQNGVAPCSSKAFSTRSL